MNIIDQDKLRADLESAKKLLNVTEFVNNLNGLWLIQVVVGDNQEQVIERRNVKNSFLHFFNRGANINEAIEMIENEIATIDVISSPGGSDDDFGKAIAQSTTLGEMWIEDLMQGTLDAAEFPTDEHSNGEDDYVALCNRISITLGISDDDSETNAQYWQVAYEDGLTAINAVVSSTINAALN